MDGFPLNEDPDLVISIITSPSVFHLPEKLSLDFWATKMVLKLMATKSKIDFCTTKLFEVYLWCKNVINKGDKN